MSKNDNLYFIALIPQRELCDEINNFKNDFAKRFNSKKALKVMPHITLKAPFKCAANAHAELVKWFSDLHIKQKHFSFK